MNLSFDSISELRDFLGFAEELGCRHLQAAHEAANQGPYRDAVPIRDAMAEAVAAEDEQRREDAYTDALRAGRTADLGSDASAATHPLASSWLQPPEVRTGLDINDPATDRDGVRYDERIHAPSRALKADGTWKAKRGVSAELVEQVLAEQSATAAETGDETEAASDEVLVTETHPLPQDEPGDDEPEVEPVVAEAEPVVAPTGMSIDFPELVANAEVAAQDLSGDMVKVLEASREFVKATSREAFSALKAAVAPAEDGQGKALPSMNPGERRLLEAAMTLYMEQLKGEVAP